MKKTRIFWAIVLGLVFCVIGYIYATHAAENLPHFFPGYQAGFAHIHAKHSIASFIAAALCFVYAWFQSGPKNHPA